jgi:hypothetical protein
MEQSPRRKRIGRKKAQNEQRENQEKTTRGFDPEVVVSF